MVVRHQAGRFDQFQPGTRADRDVQPQIVAREESRARADEGDPEAVGGRQQGAGARKAPGRSSRARWRPEPSRSTETTVGSAGFGGSDRPRGHESSWL